MPNAICIIVDGLHAGFLGAYGNSWIETPAVDRFASQSLLFDQASIDAPDLTRQYRSLWQGLHAMALDPTADAGHALPKRLSEAGVHSVLITDAADVSRHPLAETFAERVRLEPPRSARTAKSVHTTWLAKAMAQAMDRIAAASEPFLMWIHLRGLTSAWDAPLEFREQYVEEGDPAPPEWAEVPDLMLAEDYDPDELLGIRRAYAGQVSLLDTCLGALLESIDDRPLEESTMVALGSTRSFPLGEHRRVGFGRAALYEELIHVPWIIRIPEAIAAAARSPALIQPPDISATLSDWLGCPIAEGHRTGQTLLPVMRSESDTVRDRACVLGEDGERSIRTPAWRLRLPAATAAGERGELFVKPDDRWEVNEVNDRCGDVAGSLRLALTEFELALRGAKDSQLSPLDEVLVTGID